ncbi:hypothetical protein PUR49_19490 [Streptomyces sp. BE147]|uniref:hypothetical protein n=1 Tax=Streptomyces sp. BE147 TaxID=3002524 RepID=UPI002E75E81F|nr:hypothetical protein [Streptomyces sp. BE147]MEE1738679.1 hypothetical protein [Streptomyces sp. BE147]
MRLARRLTVMTAAIAALTLSLLTPASAAPASAPGSAPAERAAASVGPVQLYIGGLGSGPYNVAVQSAVGTAMDSAVAKGFDPARCNLVKGPTVVNQLPNGYVQVAVEYLCAGDPHTPGPTFVLNRYHKSSDTQSNSWYHPNGYQLQGPLGSLYTYAAPDTVPLYLCQVRGDHFTSTDVGCEGQQYVTRLGWLYTAQPAGVATVPLLRCLRNENRQIFDSIQLNCEGQIHGGMLGYTLA